VIAVASISYSEIKAKFDALAGPPAPPSHVPPRECRMPFDDQFCCGLHTLGRGSKYGKIARKAAKARWRKPKVKEIANGSGAGAGSEPRRG